MPFNLQYNAQQVEGKVCLKKKIVNTIKKIIERKKRDKAKFIFIKHET